MRFSYNELSQYFSDALPPVEILTEALITHAFEVEEIVAKDNQDWELDLKVLPDRASDAKTSLGMAREVSAVLNQALKSEYQELPTADSARVKIIFTNTEINHILGLKLSVDQIVNYLKRVRVVVEITGEQLTALIPAERLDLNLREDLADEVARLHGYDNIPARSLVAFSGQLADSSDFSLSNQVREQLLGEGYTEIYGYTFTDHGEVEVAKPLASDKAWLRTNLSEGMKKTIELNLQNVIFDTDVVKLFEIGTVFIGDQEEIHVAVGTGVKKPKSKLEVTENKLNDWLDKVPAKPADLNRFIKPEFRYQPFSLYPRILRDVALFVPEAELPVSVAELIKQQAGPLLAAGPYLFDTFTKDDKKSLAFRLVFQAPDRTLSDQEVNSAMIQVNRAVEIKGWVTR